MADERSLSREAREDLFLEILDALSHLRRGDAFGCAVYLVQLGLRHVPPYQRATVHEIALREIGPWHP